MFQIVSICSNDEPGDLMSELNLVSSGFVENELSVSRTTLWRLRQEGLPCRKIGRTIRYPLDEVHAWIKAKGIELRSNRVASHTGERSQMTMLDAYFYEPSDLDGETSSLPPCHWSPSVALDPKHRPQNPYSPSSTARMSWRKYPQEAHLLDSNGHRYRRLSENEIAVIQGFPSSWGQSIGLTHRERIAGLGNAVPPPLGRAVFEALATYVGESPKTTVEVCAGFGGLVLGAHQFDGIDTLALIDNWDPAVRVLRSAKVWDPSIVHLADVRGFDWSDYIGKVGVLSGGPPCQPWSQAGHSKGADDERDLLGDMPEIVEKVQPNCFVFENVPGLVSQKNRPYVKALIDKLKCNGRYGVAIGAVQAADYGVPQRRKRVLIVGFRGKTVGAVHEFFDSLYALRTHFDPSRVAKSGLQPWNTINDALPNWSKEVGWRRWFDELSEDPGLTDETGSGIDARTEYLEKQDRASQVPVIGLNWPGRGHSVRWTGHHWSVGDDLDSSGSDVLPLIPVGNEGHPLEDPWYLRGSHVESLESLRVSIGRRAKLVYIESPRLETDLTTFQAEDARGRLNAWLSLNQASIRRAFSLVEDSGVLTVLAGVDEQPYLQVMLDEALGPENRVGTVVWQKGYSVQGQKKDRPKSDIYATHDYLLIYSRRREACLASAALKGPPKNFANPDNDPRRAWKAEQKGANYPRSSADFSVNLPPYRWKVIGGDVPDWFWRISPKSGVIWAPAKSIQEAGEWTIIVEVADKEGNTAEEQIVIRVSDDGSAPAPVAPPWLIARNESGNPTNDDSPANAKTGSGNLRVVGPTELHGVVGRAFYACLEADGGAPYRGTTRPGKSSTSGKSRYWDVSYKTLEDAAARDAVDFKSKDDSIPAIKVYLDGASFTYLNQISTWRGDGAGKQKGGGPDPLRVGWGQDAKKELEDLKEKGIVDEVVNFGKPTSLMTRLIALFTEEGDFVVDVGSPTSEMAAMSCQLNRRTVYVEMPGTDEYTDRIRIPRLLAAAKGEHPSPSGVLFFDEQSDAPASGYYVGAKPKEMRANGAVCVYRLGEPFVRMERASGICTVDYTMYRSGSDEFHQALASSEGLVWMRGEDGRFASSLDGNTVCLHFDGTFVLDGKLLSDVVTKHDDFLRDPNHRIRIYFHRGYGKMSSPFRNQVELRHVPFDLTLASRGWA